MRLTAGELSDLGGQWFGALSGLRVWHPNATSKVLLHLSGDPEPVLKVSLDATVDTRDRATPMRSPFVISCVRLTFFPGTALARAWFAAAFAGFCAHEALELVTFEGRAVLDPHAEPYDTNPVNRGLRDGFPAELTERALRKALAVAMPEDAAFALWLRLRDYP